MGCVTSRPEAVNGRRDRISYKRPAAGRATRMGAAFEAERKELLSSRPASLIIYSSNRSTKLFKGWNNFANTQKTWRKD